MKKAASLASMLLAIAGISSRGAGQGKTIVVAHETQGEVTVARTEAGSQAQTRTDLQVTADQVMRRNLEVMGGSEKVHAIRSWRATGTIVTPPISEGGDPIPKVELQPMPLSVVVKQPNLSRLEMGSPPDTMVTVHDGQRAWTNAPGSGHLQEMKETEGIEGLMRGLLKLLPETLRPVADYRNEASSIELAGKEKVGERDAYKVKIRRKNGEESNLLIDVRTLTKIKQSHIFGTLDVDVHFGDYRSVEGVTFPHLLEFKGYSGQTFARLTLAKIELNPRLEDATFRAPAQTEKR